MISAETPGLDPPFEPADVTPAKLAPWLSIARAPTEDGARMRARLAARLLELTVRQAIEQTEHYRESLEPWREDFAAERLGELPVLRRQDLAEAGQRIRSIHADFGLCSYTSGTTETPLVIDRSLQEQRYLQELFGRLFPTPTESRAVLALLAATWHHGRKLEIPGPFAIFPVSLVAKAGFEIAAGLLSRSFRVGGVEQCISSVAGPTNRIQQLTEFLRARGLDAPPNPIDRVSLSGQCLGPHARTDLSRFWGSGSVRDSYSLTEMFGSADWCSCCEGYHFDTFIVPEVVDLDHGGVVETGRGLLVLTALYPFTQMTPLIRYQPGDIVEVGRGSCTTGRTSFRFLGRSSRFLRLHGGAIVTSADVVEAVAGIPEVRRFEDPAPIPDECKFAGVLPVFAFASSPGPVVNVELATSPSAIHPGRLSQIGQHIADVLRHRVGGPSDARFDVEVRLCAPSELKVTWTSRP